jgi:hypothetical protein
MLCARTLGDAEEQLKGYSHPDSGKISLEEVVQAFFRMIEVRMWKEDLSHGLISDGYLPTSAASISCWKTSSG